MKTFIHCFVERDVFLFTAIDLTSCIASLETTGNLETSTSCIGSGYAVVWFSFVSVIISWTRDHTDLEQMLKKNRQNIRQNRDLNAGFVSEEAH